MKQYETIARSVSELGLGNHHPALSPAVAMVEVRPEMVRLDLNLTPAANVFC